MRKIFVSEIFESISGEIGGFPQGSECLFIRLSGCNLRCSFCDAGETQIMNSNQAMSISEVMERVLKSKMDNIVITGGEPLLQKTELKILVKELNQINKRISIETNGTFSVPLVISDLATIVMDYKLNYPDKMDLHYFLELKNTDFIKFVIDNRIEMALAIDIHKLLYTRGCKAQFAYSPVLSDPKLISEFLFMKELSDRSNMIVTELAKRKLTGILNIQIHKIIGMK